MTRVRFAPSPTGYLHVGSARTALFNWLLARHNKGTFILRIEDTDALRSSKEYLDEILESLQWLGLNWDEGPYFQKNRLKLYREYAEKLIAAKRAYYEGSAVKFKIPAEPVKINDLVHGDIEFDNALLGELVIIKSDGFPTYNFACAIDDADMGITHVVRGDDHISNTPKQLALYNALGIKPPAFAHIPLILGTDRSKLSKRHGAVAIREYKENGYLPAAMINFLALLGWSPKDNREILPPDELIACFSIDGINETNAVFDSEKLAWLNGQYIKKEDPQKILGLIAPKLIDKNYIKKDYDKEYLLKIISLFQPRIKLVDDLLEDAAFFFEDKLTYDEAAVAAQFKKPGTKEKLSKFKEKIAAVENYDEKSLEEATRALAGEMKIKAAELIHPTRVALSGKSVGPGLFEMMALLGKERTLARLDAAIKMAQ
ncbi:MAG: glutamate--tRNA ligase [Candidatus Omnitrophota bacterium]